MYAELRVLVNQRDHINIDLNRVKGRIHNWLDRYFPEFTTVFKKWEGKAAWHSANFHFPGCGRCQRILWKIGSHHIGDTTAENYNVSKVLGPYRELNYKPHNSNVDPFLTNEAQRAGKYFLHVRASTQGDTG